MAKQTWTQFDQDIVSTLTCQVRVLSLDQIGRGWNQPTNDARRQLTRLVSSKLIQTAEWLVVPPPIGQRPMYVWKPGDEEPDAWRLSQAVQARWRKSASRHTVYQATDLAARLFGSSAGRPSRVYERQHDLLLAEVFVRYREELPALAEYWVGEEALPKAEYGVKNPDAFLIDDELRPRRVIESAGAYSQQQVETFHEYCRLARLPYELW